MKLNTLFIITGILGLFFGIVLLLFPGGFAEFYGGALSDSGKFNSQLQGAAYLGFAFLLLFATKAKENKALMAIVTGLSVHFVIGFVISLKWQLAGIVNAWGWSTVAIFGLLSIGYLYYLIRGAK